ncbi:DUF2917 domain-containing protein [Geomonas sp. Red32]|uniref:DUF2917 domain-containing protein n=1 Tax=Geomonas sp. Red32 TaxID=2912856 RepID=UPI00202CE39D|nr:DUF2917 domain-containing protein [Geomonas sp. Red32]MCM0080482.1 DUF2917 domain-containing protein [Geomonas sp. Red32]
MNYQLRKGEVVTVLASRAVAAVWVLSGRVWITRDGDPRDYCIEAGTCFPSPQAGRLVIEALEEVSLSVVVQQPASTAARVILSLTCQPHR